ncbi:efflux transporter outer membrane subunit [uncultured Cohaesibacter sp.]|uniref:efflux transporter outer membrane subunit n=1 Tax=uncultured Cohaesibacter sp. TaxID=1002546 RepID=UPI00292FEA62|nr:efflux transporter outer membrane subunit [uncultured Cohaesibacter sp.]
MAALKFTHILPVIVAVSLMVSGCSMKTDLGQSDLAIAARWHETLPHGGQSANMLSWWQSFGDSSLLQLIELAQNENPDLASAAADIEKARATLASSRAALLPSLDGSGAVDVSGTEGDRANRVTESTTTSGGLDASWELDLFGKNRSKRQAARERLGKQVANWHDARVSLAAEVADDYVQYRACRQLVGIYQQELVSQRETINATAKAVGSGFSSSSDLALAKASAASSASTLTEQKAECKILVKTIAQLTGGDETRVIRLLDKGRSSIPHPKTFNVNRVPADALRQRPDIQSLEREVAASMAEVGAANADLYPSLTLGGSITLSTSTLIGQSAPWSFGPALSLPLFDGGTRRAAVKSSIADYHSAVASYKSGVLSAVREVETALVHVNSTSLRMSDVKDAAENYRSHFTAIDTNWKAGNASLLDREDARRSALSAEVTLIEIRRDATRYWISLYKALGGGWQSGKDSAFPEKNIGSRQK